MGASVNACMFPGITISRAFSCSTGCTSDTGGAAEVSVYCTSAALACLRSRIPKTPSPTAINSTTNNTNSNDPPETGGG